MDHPASYRRTLTLVAAVASLPKDIRPEGLVFEDPTGEVFPWRMGELVAEVRTAMNVSGWTSGHLLIHMHHGYGMYVPRESPCMRALRVPPACSAAASSSRAGWLAPVLHTQWPPSELAPPTRPHRSPPTPPPCPAHTSPLPCPHLPLAPALPSPAIHVNPLRAARRQQCWSPWPMAPRACGAVCLGRGPRWATAPLRSLW
jgi:hypothetical protein